MSKTMVALDFSTRKEVYEFLLKFQEPIYVKIGMELTYSFGFEIVREVKAMGHQIFLDLKLHDIPNTVKQAMKNLAKLDVDVVNLHAAGGSAMMKAAIEGLEEGAVNGKRPLCIAVTQLTSTSNEAMNEELLIPGDVKDVVISYAKLAKESGLDGVVCSVHEAKAIHIEKTVAKNLLDIQAVSLQPNNPFTWASGIKSPIYCDNRLVLSFPEKRTVVVQGFVELIKQEYAEAEVIVGTATAGIPWGAMVADKLEKPFGYVRSSNKSHGKGNKIEGKIEQGAKVVVVEDLISTGGSVKDVIESLREAGAEVLGVVAIFTYLLPASTELFHSISCEFKTLSNYDVLIDVALEHAYIKDGDLEKLKAWKQDPKDESWMEK